MIVLRLLAYLFIWLPLVIALFILGPFFRGESSPCGEISPEGESRHD